MELKTMYDYLKFSGDTPIPPALLQSSLERLRGKGVVFLALDGKVSVILMGAEKRNTFMEMGIRGHLKGEALKDYLTLKEEAPELAPQSSRFEQELIHHPQKERQRRTMEPEPDTQSMGLF